MPRCCAKLTNLSFRGLGFKLPGKGLRNSYSFCRLVFRQDLHAASGASEPAGTAEVAVQALQDMVSQQRD